MKRFSLWTDVLFYSACALALSFCILRFYRVPLWLSLLLGLLLAVAAGLLAFLLLFGSAQKKILSKQEAETRDKLLLHLALEKPERVRAALLEAYVADGREAHCEGDELTVEGLTAVPLFTMEPLSADGVAPLIRRFGRDFLLVCHSLTAEAEKLLASFSIKAECGDEVYALFSRTDTMPETLICGEVPRRTARQRLVRSLGKGNARPFFVSGILLLIMSLFTPFSLYYILTGGLLLIVSVSVKIFGFSA